MKPASPQSLACFVSPHGLGHAARVAALLTALQRRRPGLGIELFTLAPADFFVASGCRNLHVHREITDIGFVQKSALVEDIPETARRLDAFLPFESALVARLAATLRDRLCAAVLCDIAPLGLAVARAVGIPSVLIENFTWDNLYAHYAEHVPRMRDHADAMRRCFATADLHIQTEPICHPVSNVALTSRPVGRTSRVAAESIRQQLGVPPDRKMVLITMGGVSERTPMLAHLADRKDLVFVIAWGAPQQQVVGNVIALPLQSAFYHPDLVNAADVVIGKLGYSTLAEVLQTGLPFGYLARQNYPEMPALIHYAQAHLSCQEVVHADLDGTNDPDLVDRLLALPRRPPLAVDGADQIAEFLQRELL